jgi:hypothetical protein
MYPSVLVFRLNVEQQLGLPTLVALQKSVDFVCILGVVSPVEVFQGLTELLSGEKRHGGR